MYRNFYLVFDRAKRGIYNFTMVYITNYEISSDYVARNFMTFEELCEFSVRFSITTKDTLKLWNERDVKISILKNI